MGLWKMDRKLARSKKDADEKLSKRQQKLLKVLNQGRIDDIEIAWGLAYYEKAERDAGLVDKANLEWERILEEDALNFGKGSSNAHVYNPRPVGSPLWWQVEHEGKLVPRCLETLLIEFDPDGEEEAVREKRYGYGGTIEACQLPKGHGGKHGRPGVRYQHNKVLEPILIKDLTGTIDARK